MLRGVCRSGCGGADAHPVSDMRRLVTRLRRAPIRRVVRRGGRRMTVRVSADDLLGLLVASDVAPGAMRLIPPAVRSALGGNSGPLVRMKLRATGSDDDRVSVFSPAVYAATTCEEGTLAWDATAPAATRRAQARAALAAIPAAQLAPFDRAAALNFGLLGLCEHWPARERVAAPAPALPTTVPALVLSGTLDLRTPLENARRLADALHGELVTERGAGHQVLGIEPNGCATPAVDAFLGGRPLPRCGGDVSIGIGPAAVRRGAPLSPAPAAGAS